MGKKINIKVVLIICLLLFLLTLAILLFVYPGFLRPQYGLSALPNRRLSSQDEVNLAAKIAGDDSRLTTVFRQNFLKDLKVEGKKRENQIVIAGYSLEDHDTIEQNSDILLSNQLLWGRYLASKGKLSEFESWLQLIKEHFILEDGWALKIDFQANVLDQSKISWAYDLTYADILLTAYNRNPSSQILLEIHKTMDRAYPYFTNSQSMPNLDLKLERIFYPESSAQSEPSSNPQLLDPYKEAKFIRLSDINLFVLESFSLLDSKWQAVFDQWQALIEHSKETSSAFYPLGIMPNLQDYVATGRQAFLSFSLDNVKLLYTSSSKASDQYYAACRAFYKQTILDGSGLFTAYHINSLEPMTGDMDLPSLALLADYFMLKQQAAYPEADDLVQRIKTLAEVFRYRDQLSELDQLFYRKRDDVSPLQFQAEDQILLMTTGLFD